MNILLHITTKFLLCLAVSCTPPAASSDGGVEENIDGKADNFDAADGEDDTLDFDAEPDVDARGEPDADARGEPDADARGEPDADEPDGDRDADVDVARPIIMLTGFWHPTGDMIRHFSQDQELNTSHWMGEDWEGRGYDIISFFPDPDANYRGDFEVDYQSVSEDFWRYADELRPIAIMSFGAGAGPWEIEWNARNLESGWGSDRRAPYEPTELPPDDTAVPGFTRHSSLPVTQIEAAVDALGVFAWVDWDGDPGAYLCEYMAYHVMWYRDECVESGECDCLMAGFIHVASSVSVREATQATEASLRELIEALDEARF